MARPLKRTVDYFPHFVNSGKTLLILQNEFGNDGYAFWFKLLSLLCRTDGIVYDYNNSAAWRLLLAETSVSEDMADKILQLLADIKAIDPDLYLSKIIWVQNLVDNLGDVFMRRRNGSIPEKPVLANINLINVSRKPQTRLDYTKLDQTIPNQTSDKNNRHGFTTEIVEQVKAEFPALAEHFDIHVDNCVRWWAQQKKQVKDAKRALRNWMVKESGNLKPNPLSREPARLGRIPTDDELDREDGI